MKISRQKFLAGMGGLALLGAGASSSYFRNKRYRAEFSKRKSKQPNILLILTDQERHSSLLPASLHLPNRERIFEKSTRFSNMQHVTGLCSMARANIYTGLHYQHNGVYENVPIPFAHDLYENIPTLGTMLQDVGYETAYFGKWHLTHLPWTKPVGRPTIQTLFSKYGFEISDQEFEVEGTQGGYKRDPFTAKIASDFLRSKSENKKPWFAAINFLNPHDIMFFLASKKQLETYRFNPMLQEGISKAPKDPIYAHNLDFSLPANFGTKGDIRKPFAHTLFADVMNVTLGRIPEGDKEGWFQYENYYLNCLRDGDRHIGTVLDALDEMKLWENTVVVFTSDHGELSGAHGLRGKGNTIYRESSNVPFTIWHPDIKRDSDTAALASQIDITPTLLSFAGVSEQERREKYPNLKGFDLSKAMGPTAEKNPGASGRDGILYQWDSRVFGSPETAKLVAKSFEHTGWKRAWTMLTGPILKGFENRHSMKGSFDGRYKFARYFRPTEHQTPKNWDQLSKFNDLEFYDTQKDPLERKNVAYLPEYRETVLKLSNLTNALLTREVGQEEVEMLPGPEFIWNV